MATRVDRETFLHSLQQSGLVSTREFRRIVEKLGDLPKPRTIARALVEWGLITKFQAELLLIGRAKGLLLGPYKILDKLAQGGMGRVYKAIHQTMNRIVALKVLAPNPDKARTAKAQEYFQRELRAAAQLNHPNIITVYDANEIGGRNYLAMEFVDGPNLEQLVREQGPLPVGMACEIIRQVANGLEHAHEQDMIHRDIKPANLLLQPAKNLQSFVVKILDFGLARLNDPGLQDTAGTIETRENTVMGTPDFLSPEQARNLHQVSIRSDIYSLGCTFYFLLTGKVPFPGGTTLEKLIRQSTEEPRPVDEVRPDVPDEVAAILRTMMAKNPGDRYQSPQELADALMPHAVACAPTWDNQARHAADTMHSTTPAPVEDESFVTFGSGASVGTLPPGIAPTPLSPSDNMILMGPDPEDRRRPRTVLLWSIGVVTTLAGLAASLFFLTR